MLYTENPICYQKTSSWSLVGLNEFGKVARYKSDAQKYLAFLYSNNNRSKRENNETIPSNITSKRVKYLIIKVPKEAKASVVAQTVKNLPAMWETQVQSLGWEDPLEWRWKSTPVFLPGESHGQRSLAGHGPWGRKAGHNWAINTTIQGTEKEAIPYSFLEIYLFLIGG